MIGDDILEEAKKICSKPENFSFFCVEVEVRTGMDKQVVLLSEEDANCCCAFFEKWNTCIHVMAAKLFLDRPISFDVDATPDTEWRKKLQSYNTVDLVIASELSRTTIINVKAGTSIPKSSKILNALKRGIELLDKHLDFEKWRQIPIAELARLLEMDERDAALFRIGTFKPTRKQRKALLDAMGITEE